MTDILYNKAVIMSEYYFNIVEIFSLEFLIQIKNFWFKNHIVNQIKIRLILLLMNMNNEDDRKKSITIDFIEIINAVFINKIADLKLFSMNLIKYIKLIHQLTTLKMNIIMFQNSVFTLLNNKILTEVIIIETILSEHTKNENIDQISIISSAEFFKLNCWLNTVNVLNSNY